MERDPLSRASDLVFYWQPVRDSNPCRHLERATRTVRLVLSSTVLCGLSRNDATRCVGSCWSISADISALIGKSIGKIKVGDDTLATLWTSHFSRIDITFGRQSHVANP